MLNKISLSVIIAFALLALTASQCPPDKPPIVCPEDPVAEVDPSHAQFSPVASHIFLQLHTTDTCKEKGNLMLYVQYTAEEYSKDSLSFFHDGAKLVMRDDGVFPDKKKDDQEYTVIINIDTTLLRKIYGDDVSKSKSKDPAIFVDFNGREVTKSEARPIEILSNRLDFDALKRGEKVEIMTQFPVLTEIRNNSVYVIDLGVVEDPSRTLLNKPSNPNGSWTFKKIMEGMANTASTGVNTEDFTLHWLNTFNKPNNIVNGDILSVKSGVTAFINAWPKVNGTNKIDMDKSPFKLLAIVNRLDLMENPVYGTNKNGGELRFVFGMMQNNIPQSGVIIFEFGVNKSGKELKDYADKWVKLSTFTVGSTDYNELLEEITNEIIASGKNPSKPNGSNLNQLRTDDISLGNGWELREFNINPTTHFLENVTIKQEPAGKYNIDQAMQAVLNDYANKNERQIEKNRYNIPLQFDGKDFLGGVSTFPNSGVWGDPQRQVIKSDKARFNLSLNTCGGCHLSEAQTPGFLHNQPAAFSSVTGLSGFIRGNNFGKPLGTNTDHFEVTDIRGNKHSFNDLARRAKLLWAFTNSHPTLFGLQFNPVNMEH